MHHNITFLIQSLIRFSLQQELIIALHSQWRAAVSLPLSLIYIAHTFKCKLDACFFFLTKQVNQVGESLCFPLSR
jgi:hypothetical protein